MKRYIQIIPLLASMAAISTVLLAGMPAVSASESVLVLPPVQGVVLWPAGARIVQMFDIQGCDLTQIAKSTPGLDKVRRIKVVDYVIPGPPAPPDKILEFYAGTLIQPDWLLFSARGGPSPRASYKCSNAIVSVIARPRGAMVIEIDGKMDTSNLPAVDCVVRNIMACREQIPTELMSRLNSAIDLQQAGRIGEAIACLRSIICDCPKVAAAHYYLAVSLVDQCKYDEAGQQFREAIVLAPLNTVFRVRYGAFLVSRGDIENGQYELTQAAAIAGPVVDAGTATYASNDAQK